MLPASRSRILALVSALAIVAASCAEPAVPEVQAPATPTATPAPTSTPVPVVVDQPTPTPRPFEREPGITEDTIRIGVIYDTGIGDSAVADQMSRSAAEAVEAWARSVNTEGGIAGGRSIEVVRIETQPLLGDHADAIDRACNAGLFALVGSAALFDSLGVDQLASPNCGLPDFPSLVFSRERIASTVTTVSNPIMSDVWQAGWARYYATERPKAAASAATMYLEFPASIINGERTIEAASAQGYEFVYREQMPFDTDFSAEAASLAASGARLLTWTSDGGRLIGLLGALDDGGGGIGRVDCGIMCYSDTWVEAAGPLGEGVTTWLPTMPLEESENVPEMLRYLFWLGTADGTSDPTSVGILAWASALLFEESVNIAIGRDTADYNPDNLTRAGVIAAANTITEWDAKGLHGPSNPADAVPSACFVLLGLADGVWERVFPDRQGGLDCALENLVPLTITLRLGEDDEDLEVAPVDDAGEPVVDGDEG